MFSPLSVAALYAVWSFARSFLHRGWWLVTSVYLVTQAELSAFQLVFLGTAQGITILVAEIPAGVFADAYSRKWSLVIAHALMGLAMISTGLVLTFPALVLTQMLWGLSWTFSSGADVAWLTDELNDSDAASNALIRAAKWGHAGSALGITSLGTLAWATSLATAMVSAGLGIWLLGLVVVSAFKETGFIGADAGKVFTVASERARFGLRQLRLHRVLGHILLYTYLINGADEAFGRLHAKHLIELGLPLTSPPIVWLSALAIAGLVISISALSAVQHVLRRTNNPAFSYAIAAGIGGLGLGIFALAPSTQIAAVGVLLVSGIATSVIRTVSIVWTNEQTTRDVRATVQSFLSLAENIGETSLGFLLAVVASGAGIPTALLGSGAVFWGVAVLAIRLRSR